MLFHTFTLLIAISFVAGQRITTIQLDGVQYFISRMNPYSPELNYFLSYQYCRSIGLQLASFETKEKADSIMQYLSNAGYNKYDFWTSGNKLGTDMLIWMSTGLPFNATFDYMRKLPGDDMPVARQLGAVEQRKDSGSTDGCVVLRAPDLTWDTDDCTHIKDFICEQTRCYYYNYGSIPVSSAQGYAPGSAIKSSTTKSVTGTESSAMTTTTITDESMIAEHTIEATVKPVHATVSASSIKGRTLNDKANNSNSGWQWPHHILLEKPVKAPIHTQSNPTLNPNST